MLSPSVVFGVFSEVDRRLAIGKQFIKNIQALGKK